MSKSNDLIFTGLKIIAWVIFVGLSIEAGGLLVNFVFSIYNPDFVSKLYNKLDLSAIYNRSAYAFFSIYSFLLVISILKAYLFYIVIKLVTKLDLANPFNGFVSEQITQLSYYTFSIGILSYVARQTTKQLYKRGFVIDDLNQFWVDSQAFILMAAVIYIIATIVKRGIELQTENELTV